MKRINPTIPLSGVITVGLLLSYAIIDDYKAKEVKQQRELRVGQLWGNNLDHNPFEQDTITILAIKQGFVLYQVKSTKVKESCSVYDFKASDLYLISKP